MNKKIMGIAALMLAASSLAACGDKSAKIMEGFDKSLDADHYSLTYSRNYKVEADQQGGGLENFLKDEEDVIKVDYDRAGLSYFAVSSQVYNKLQPFEKGQAVEQIVYKSGNDYKLGHTYSTEEMGMPTAPTAAQVEEAIKEETTDTVGYINSDMLQYSIGDSGSGKEWYKKYFIFKDNVSLDDIVGATYKQNDIGGVTATYKAKTIGYKGDSGDYFQFPKAAGYEYAADVVVDTDAKGRVVSMVETYHAAMAMPLWTPNPVITITGTRSIAVDYTADLVTKTNATMTHAEPKAQIYYSGTAEHGTYKVRQFSGNPMNMPEVASLSKLAMGSTLYFEVTPEAGYEAKVYVNRAEVTPTSTPEGNFFMYTISAPENLTIEVVFELPEEDGEDEKTVLARYEGNFGDLGLAMEFYDDETFVMTVPKYNNAVAIEGDYEVDEQALTITISIVPGSASGFPADASMSVCVFHIDPNTGAIHTDDFYNHEELTLSPAENNNDNNEEGGEEGPGGEDGQKEVRFVYETEIDHPLTYHVELTIYTDNTWVMTSSTFGGNEIAHGTYVLDFGAHTLAVTADPASINSNIPTTQTEMTYSLNPDYSITGEYFDGTIVTFTVVPSAE